MVSWTNNLGLIKTGTDSAYDENFVEIDARYADLNSAIKSLQSRFGVNNIAFNKNRYYLTAVSDEELFLKPESEDTLTKYAFSSLIDGEAYVVFFANSNSQMGEGLTESTDPTKLKLTNNDLVVKLTKEINGIFRPYFVVIQNVVGFGYVPCLTQLSNNKIGVEFIKVTAADIEKQVEQSFSLEPLITAATTGTFIYTVESIDTTNVLLKKGDGGTIQVPINNETEIMHTLSSENGYENSPFVVEFYIIKNNSNTFKRVSFDYSYNNNGVPKYMIWKIDGYNAKCLLEVGDQIVLKYKRFPAPAVQQEASISN